ncbi:MAG: hypothetical protein ABI647_19440 [Gemmatimonadota bacterium]
MNPNDLVPLLGMATGMLSVVVIGIAVVKVAQSSIGQALARRIGGRGASDADSDALRTEVAELRDTVGDLQHRLVEAEERLDFSERLLAQGRPRDQA